MKIFFKTLFCVLIFSTFSFYSYALSLSKAAEDEVFKSVVFIKVPAPDQDGLVVDGYCNATLLDNMTLITAGHCFLKSTVLTGEPFQIEVGEYKYVEKNGVMYRVGYVVRQKFAVTAKLDFLSGVNPNSDKISPDEDIVRVRLDQSLTLATDFPYAELWVGRLPQLSSANNLQVVSINPIETISHNDTKQVASLNSYKQALYQLQSQSTSRVAPGDSGAPLFALINGKNYLVGVVKGRAETLFTNWDVFVLSNGRF